MIRWLTLDEVAEELGLGPVEVHWLIRSGRLPGIFRVVERDWLVRRDELAAYMEDEPD